MIVTFLFLLLCIALYMYNTRTFDYWKKRGIKYEKPIPAFGTNAKGYLLRRSTSQLAEDIYWKYPDERVVGTFRSTTPELLVRDPEIAKCILVTDFNHFAYRRVFVSVVDEYEPLMRHLFSVDGDLWRLLRQRLTPAFSSGKLKAMFPLIVERAERLHTRIQAAAGAPVDARDLMAGFTIDVVGACGFGLDMDSLSEENSKFRQLGTKIFRVTVKKAINALLKEMFPVTFKHIKWLEEVEDEIISLVSFVLNQRNYEPTGRNDFIDLLLECKKKGKMVGESMEKFKADGTPEIVALELTEDLLAAQVFVFFAAGFETSSSTSSFTLHLLAYNPEEQKKVQDDVDRVLAQHENKLSYDAVKEMTYLEWAFKESMRMMPSVAYLARQCSRKYKFADIDLTIDEGVKIMIPLQAMQNDPKFFDSPEEYRPERFDPKEWGAQKAKFAYLPFGEGPRACIGERLGLMQSLAGLAAVLSKFSVEPAPSSRRHPEVEPIPGVVQTIRGGLPLLFRERKKGL